MRSRLLLSALAILLLLATPARQAAAQTPAAVPDCDADSACAQLAERAYQASQDGGFDKAQQAYEQAYARVPDPKLLYNLARVLHKASRFADAVTYYQRYIDVGGGGNQAQLRKAQRYIEDARRVATAIDRSATEPPRTPVYRKWWLWTTVGVVAAGVALGVGLGLASRQPDTTDAYSVVLTK